MNRFFVFLLVFAALTKSTVASEDYWRCPKDGKRGIFLDVIKSKELKLNDLVLNSARVDYYVSGIPADGYNPEDVKNVKLGFSSKRMFVHGGYDSSKKCSYVMRDANGQDIGPIEIAPKL